MKTVVTGMTAVLFAVSMQGQAFAAGTAACEQLSSLTLPDTTITSAKIVAAGQFVPPTADPDDPADTFKQLPAFCRVTATLKPSADSDIKIEVWLPDASAWNGKYQAVGNGGWAGSISYANMVPALSRGYATSSTDTGHTGGGGKFALGHLEKLIDYAYRSEHEMTVQAKAIIAAHYGSGPKFSYWNACSSGGKQALMEAQKYPRDFNGIIAGAPAINWIGRAAQGWWIWQAVHKEEASLIPPSKFQMIHEAVLNACDAKDGVKDGVLEDPTRCTFDPKTIQCSGADGPSCLTPPQVEAARAIYSPVVNPRTRELIFEPHQPGSELGWATMASGKTFSTSLDHWRYVVYKDANWDGRNFDFDRDYTKALQTDNIINALDPNLQPYFSTGGKLIQYHGWADPQISPGSSVDYYKSVVGKMGNVSGSYRLFMVPGMGHCRGGDGTSTFDMVSALEQWVEHGKAPEQVPASRARSGKVDRTRPLCPYPQVAVYSGSGSTDEAANFSCKAQ